MHSSLFTEAGRCDETTRTHDGWTQSRRQSITPEGVSASVDKCLCCNTILMFLVAEIKIDDLSSDWRPVTH